VARRKSLTLANTFSRIVGSGSKRVISIAPIIVEKVAKKALSLSAGRRPGMYGCTRRLYFSRAVLTDILDFAERVVVTPAQASHRPRGVERGVTEPPMIISMPTIARS
jgi:hypothetical protein